MSLKNPEGQLVDVTQDGVNPKSTHRYFLPVDLKLVLNGVHQNNLKSYLCIGVFNSC